MANTLLTPTAVTRKALRILHQKCRFIGGVNRQYDDTADFMVEATAYYRKIDDGEVFAVTDLGDGLREFRVATGYWSLSQFVDGQLLGSFIHRRVNQGTTEDLPLIDFTDSMVQTRRNADANMLPAAICRVMLGSMRLAKFRA
jgi:hypothetical protein